MTLSFVFVLEAVATVVAFILLLGFVGTERCISLADSAAQSGGGVGG